MRGTFRMSIALPAHVSIEGVLLVPAARVSTRRWDDKIEVYLENTENAGRTKYH